ncbi:MAG: TIGR03618 family F420-dependent PPOX class oxidoreductase [Sphaerobacteraceae bacterium]|nr:MAG: TIGR03618 family F420-dependent PPOX class oxidoreductase [Sphaerobacteraceae bacterium]
MHAISIPAKVRDLLDGPNYAHLTTLMEDGSPRNHVVWIWRDGDQVIIPTGAENFKGSDMRRDPRVSISLVDHQNPYRMASLRGRVLEVRPHDDFELMDQIAHTYTSQPFPDRNFELAYFVIDVLSAYERQLGAYTHHPGEAATIK